MRRRDKGTGSVYQRKSDGRWCGQVTLPNGKVKSFYAPKNNNHRKVVLAKIDEARRALERGLPVPSERQTVGGYLTSWLEMLSDVRPSTKNRYAQDVRRIVQELGSASLAKLQPPQVQLFYAHLQERGLSSTTIHHTHATLHHALHDAQRMGLVALNASEYVVNVPTPSHVEMQALDEAQARKLREIAQGHRFEALYTLAVMVGMRRGELLALKWADVDLERGTLSVRASVQIVDRAAERLQIAETKTANSRRMIHLPPQALDALRSHRTRQIAERLRQGADWQERGLVFPGHRGGLLNPKTPGEQLTKLLAANDLPMIRFHDLRHTAISIALARGIAIHAVAEMVGDTERTIMKTYAHVTPKMREDAAAIIGAVFGG